MSEAGEDLESRHDAALQRWWHAHDLPQQSVHPEADRQLPATGLEVDVRSAIAGGPAQDGTHQPDGRRPRDPRVLPKLHFLTVHRGGFGGGLLQKLGDLLALAEHPAKHPPQIVGGDDHGAYGVSGEHLQILEGMQIGGVLHGDDEAPLFHAKRQHPVTSQDLLVHQPSCIRVDVLDAQLDEPQAELAGQGPG